jgi:hypothetical protein
MTTVDTEEYVFIPSLSSRIVIVTVFDPTMTSLEFPTLTVTAKVSSGSRITSPLMLRSKQTSWLMGEDDGITNSSLASGRKSFASIQLRMKHHVRRQHACIIHANS